MEEWSIDLNHYRSPKIWAGRDDGSEEDVERWHQRVHLVDLNNQSPPVLQNDRQGFALLGFMCDEGIRRNQGRIGAAEGPSMFRQSCGSLPVHFSKDIIFIDAGDIICINSEMEKAQHALAKTVNRLVQAGYRTLLIGGGHEIVYGHYNGLCNALGEKIGIINFDAHFDLRQPGTSGPSSGTGFWQIAKERSLHYLALGIQQHANTRRLFDTAKTNHVDHVLFTDFVVPEILYPRLDHMISQCNHLYITIDLDVFGAAWAPGVSASNATGLQPDAYFFRVLRYLFTSGKVRSMDIAELNPRFDQDHRTSKLAATLGFEYFYS